MSGKKIIFLSLLCIALFFSCNHQSVKIQSSNDSLQGKITIFHAGSFAKPLKTIIDSFNVVYPQIEIITEAAGSVECARKITDLNKICDVFISSDYAVIEKYLMPQYVDWYLKFAGNKMVLAYTAQSKFFSSIYSKNWQEIIQKSDVLYGRSDPNIDPCGYRTVLCLKLAEKYYKIKNLSNKLLSKDKEFIRPKEVDLLALLESNAIDYIFIYRSVAIQHKLKFIEFPDEVNLSSEKFKELYSSVNTEINGNKPGEMKTIKGEPMIYGITIPNNSTQKTLAELFVKYLLKSDKGMKIIENMGQNNVLPDSANTKVPYSLKDFTK